LNHLVATYGYWAVALVVGVESLGVPVPGETALILAAILAGHSHRLSVWALFAVAAAAAMVGDNLGFWIGHAGGYRLVRRWGHYIRLDESRLKVGRYLFDRHGAKVVFFGRFVTVLRTFAAFLAGTNRMRWGRFLIANAAGAVVWAAVYSFIPYEVGSTLGQLTTTIDIVLGALAVAVIIGSVVVLRRRTAWLIERAEDAYPGPLS
jgi:membrane protein DedA with SNARE-associated domain